jgi:hypothetical protein
MKGYYFEKFSRATLMLQLARVGYDAEMKQLATRLITDDELMHDSIIKSIMELRSVLNEMVDEAEGYRAKYQAECDKEVEENA